MVTVGIDPGTTRIGYGVVVGSGGSLRCRGAGLLAVPAGASGAEKLAALGANLEKLLRAVRPDRIGVEKLFFTKNRKTALAVAEARGVILATSTRLGIPSIELTPREVKVAVTGNGNATKEAVAKMVHLILSLSPKRLPDDATDALAIAIGASSWKRWD